MLPKSRRFVPPAERPANAPTKKEIDDLTADHIGGYTKREIMRLIEIHKHYVDFHYEPKSSDGGLIADDGTDPLFYYQSNLPVIRRLMQKKVAKDDSDDEVDDDDALELDLDTRMQELRDGVANNAIVAQEKGRLSKVIAVQRAVALNLQDNNAMLDALQRTPEIFELDPEDRVEGHGSYAAQIEMLQSLLKFRRDQNNQLKKLSQSLTVKFADLVAALQQASPTKDAGKRSQGARVRAAASAMLKTTQSDGSPLKEKVEADDAQDVDLELLQALAAENHFLRREQDYLYYRLYGCKPQHANDAAKQQQQQQQKGSATATPQNRGLPGRPPAAGGATSVGNRPVASRGLLGGAPNAQKPQTPEGPLHGPLESHPDYPNAMKAKEKAMRAEMEAVFQKLVDSEVSRQIVSTTKGADALKRLTTEVEDHKFMIEAMHKRVLNIFDTGNTAMRVNRILESRELAQHDVASIAKTLEKTIIVRGLKDFQSDASAIGQSLKSLHQQELQPQLETQALNSMELLASELTQLGAPVTEDALERMCLAVGCAGDSLQALAMKLCGSLFSTITLLPAAFSAECGTALWKVMRVLLPQWIEENLQKFALALAAKTDNHHADGMLNSMKERNVDLRRLLRQSRGSSRRGSKPNTRGNDGDGLGAISPEDPDNVSSSAPSPDVDDSERTSAVAKSRGSSAGLASSRRSATPLRETADQESQCDILKWPPNSARSDILDSPAQEGRASASGKGAASSSSPSKRKGSLSATPRSARSNSSVGFHEDHFTQTDIAVVKGQSTQTDTKAATPGSDALVHSARSGKDPSPLTLSLSRPVSAMMFPNPMVTGADGKKKPQIPNRGAIAVASIDDINTLWFECPSFMPMLQEAYIVLLRDEAAKYRGLEVRCDDDTFLAVFPSEVDALKWSAAVQLNAMHLPYPPEVLAMGCANAVPHASMLGGAVSLPSRADAPPRSTLDDGLLQHWTWRGFRIRIALHSGTITLSGGQRSDEVTIGGPHLAFATKLNMIAKGGCTVASASFLQSMENVLHEYPDSAVPFGYRVVSWEEVPRPDEDSNSAEGSPDGAVEQLSQVVFDTIALRSATQQEKDVAEVAASSCSTMLQRWVCELSHQVEQSQRGKKSKMTFVLVDVESSEDYPHYNSSMLRDASGRLLQETMRLIHRRRGRYFAVTHRSLVATFEEPVAAAQFCLQFHVLAMQQVYPQELLMIPSCKEQYEESALTWRGLRARTVGHYGPAGLVLRHLATEVLEYYGTTVTQLNEISACAPLGCVAVTRSLYNEIQPFVDMLEFPLTIEDASAELAFLLPMLLKQREAFVRSTAQQVAAKLPYAPATFQVSTFDAKRASAEYSSGVGHSAMDTTPSSTEEFGVLGVTLHSLLELWVDEEAERQAFEVRLAAAIEAEQDKGKSGGRLPTRRDCREDIIQLAEDVGRLLHKWVTEAYHGAFQVSTSTSAFLTSVFVFPNVGQSLLCALDIQRHLTEKAAALVPPALAGRFPKVFSADSGQVILEGVCASTSVHAGRVHVVYTAGCRNWAYYGTCIHQCAAIAHDVAGSGETVISDAALTSLKKHCGPAELGGLDVDEFLSTNVAMQKLELRPPVLDFQEEDVEPPPYSLPGELTSTSLHSIVAQDHMERLLYVERRPLPAAPQQSFVNPVRESELGSTARFVTSTGEQLRRQRHLRSKYGFIPMDGVVQKRGRRQLHPACNEFDNMPTYIWNAALVQRLYRAVWSTTLKASRVMGYPIEVDLDPAAAEAGLSETLRDATRIVGLYLSGSEDVDPSSVGEIRTVLDDGVAGLLRRAEEHLQDIGMALGTRLEKPPQMHRSMQSAVIIPPNEKDDSALYKPADVGPGKRVTPIANMASRPASRERSGTPTTPLGLASLSATPFYNVGTSISPAPGVSTVSVGTENPRFLSAGRRPNSRQRVSTPPTRAETGTQQTPADVPALVAMALPGALIATHQPPSTLSGLFRLGMGSDMASIRLKERRVMQLERHVEELQEQIEALQELQNPVVAALRYAAQTGEAPPIMLPRLLTPSFEQMRAKALLPPIGSDLAAQDASANQKERSASTDHVIEEHRRGDDSAGALRGRDDDDEPDFSMPPQTLHAAGNTTTTSMYDANTQRQTLTSTALSLLGGSRHMPPPSRQHWRKTSPLAPLQSSFVTTAHEGFLLSGEMTSKQSLVAPFTAAAGATRGKTPLPVPLRKQKAKSAEQRPHSVSDVSSNDPQ